MKTVSCLLPWVAASALVTLAPAATLYPTYWAESSTDASGNYTYNSLTAAGPTGGPLIGSIPTDATTESPDRNVVNYFRTDTDLVGALAAYNGSLLGNLSGATGLTATFSLNDSAMALGEQFASSDLVGETAGGETGSNAAIRLMFMGGYLGSGMPNEWWSNPAAAYVTSMDNGQDVTLTVAFDSSLWSNYNGINGSADTVEFEEALAGVTRIGLSFGSGYFFSDGFAFSTGGTASLQLFAFGTTGATGSAPEPSTFGLLAGTLAAAAALRRRKT